MATSPAPPPCSWPSRSSASRASWPRSCSAALLATPRRSSNGSRRSRSPAPASSTSASRPPPSSRWCARCWPPARPSARQPAQRRARAGRVRLGQSHRPAARGPRPPGRARRRHLQPARHAGRDVWREFYYNDAGVQIADAGHQHAAARQGLQAGRRRVARAGLQRRIHRRHRRRLPGEEDGAVGRPRIHRQRRRRRHRLDPPVRRGLPAPRAGPGPEGLPGEVRQLLPRVQPLHQRPGRGDGEEAASRPARPTSRTARCG